MKNIVQNVRKKMKQKRQKKNYDIAKLMRYLVIYLMVAFASFGLGMVYQQVILYNLIGGALSYVDIQVNFNETKFVQEFNDTLIPALKDAFNQSMVSEDNQSMVSEENQSMVSEENQK